MIDAWELAAFRQRVQIGNLEGLVLKLHLILPLNVRQAKSISDSLQLTLQALEECVEVADAACFGPPSHDSYSL